ncbi:probable DEAD-box ATP-dependent RNA helicase 48 [Tanacetum coccineum]
MNTHHTNLDHRSMNHLKPPPRPPPSPPHMGGGKDKEKRLLDQEKHLYEARVRSEIRSKLTHEPNGPTSPNAPNFKPLSPKEHIKSLADRFMKPGAEDLWKRGTIGRAMRFNDSDESNSSSDEEMGFLGPRLGDEEGDDVSLHVRRLDMTLLYEEAWFPREIESEAGDDDDTILSTKRFDECDVFSIDAKGTYFSRFCANGEQGKDALVKAKTGTGKSAAFLLPAIETVLKASASNAAKRIPPICVLIVCPTRELASQIAAEANVLLKYHEGIGVGVRLLEIIIATPGRLLDHIENKSGFSARLMKLKMLILDEADHLLDLGFRKDMEKIVDCLPRQRQSLLFTSTLPKEVNQALLIAPHEQHFQIVHRLLKDHIAQVPDYKVILFCTTAMMTSLMYSLLREMRMNVREIHSRKPPLYRTRVSEEFKEAKKLILVTSDVSARGMNYPDVSLVIQLGVPTDREQYINRLGRTGREGKGGEGILLLAPWEEYFLQEIKDLPIHKSPSPHLDPDMKVKVEKSMAKIDPSVKEAAYLAWLGYYNSIREIGRDKTTLVELGKGFCDSIGLEKVPALFRKTALKMGLKDIAGIRVRK